jgi:tetratricopeptide (TPR) repeat protein
MASLLAALLLLVPGTVLVLPPDPPPAGGEPWIAELVADQLPRTLSDLGVPVLSRADRLRAQTALEIPHVRVTRATSIRIAEAVGATRIVTGAYTLEGGKNLGLSLRILDLERGTLSAPILAGGPLEGVAALIDSLAFDVALAGPTRPSLSREELAARRAPIPYEAMRSFGRGLAARLPASKTKLFRHALGLNPDFHVARLALGRLQLEQREFSIAQATLARIPDTAAVARQARFLQGVAQLEVGRYREAAALYGTLAGVNPSAAVLNNHALALLRGGGGNLKASAVLRKAAEEAPESLDITFNLAFALLVEGEADAATFFFRGLARQMPLDRHIRVLLAWALRKAGQTAEADEEWKGVAALAPQYASLTAPDLTRRFEKILVSERPFDIGRETRSDSEVAASLLLRAQRLFETGDAEGALQEATRAGYLDPYNPRIHALLGRVHRAGGRTEQALNEFRMALWSKDDPGIRVELALLLREAGRLPESRVEAQKALALDPTREDARRLAQVP